MKSKGKDSLALPKIKGISETELLDRIERIVGMLAGNFTFGYYDIDDIKQEARILAIKGLVGYDRNLPLENYLYTHIKKRLINLIRDKYHRSDPPCKKCHGQVNGHTDHPDGKYCDKYAAWKHRNADKAGLVCPIDIGNIDDTEEKNTRQEDDIIQSLAKAEIFDLIDIKLPATMRADYLKMRAGITLPKKRRDEIINTIRDFLTPDELLDITD